MELEKLLVRAWVSAGVSWNAIDNPEMRELFLFLNPSANIPHQKKLSGPLLRQEVVLTEGELRNKVKGALTTLQCDGWKDVSKKSLIAFMFTALRMV